ncbi:MAG: hypothetical protein N4A48_01125 [Tepidibacter sp.]|jgi:hypothetical protein|nr:hypothetical protein [Tepidibacter sp.]MCT4507362.1 hypothetical protein [Tepidibacter sp.]
MLDKELIEELLIFLCLRKLYDFESVDNIDEKTVLETIFEQRSP